MGYTTVKHLNENSISQVEGIGSADATIFVGETF